MIQKPNRALLDTTQDSMFASYWLMARLSPLADTSDVGGDAHDPPWVHCSTPPTQSCLEPRSRGCSSEARGAGQVMNRRLQLVDAVRGPESALMLGDRPWRPR
jgi:hypothetical protein